MKIVCWSLTILFILGAGVFAYFNLTGMIFACVACAVFCAMTAIFMADPNV